MKQLEQIDSIINPVALQELNDDLEKHLMNLSSNVETNNSILNLAGLKEESTIYGTHQNGYHKNWEIILKWKEIFGLIAPYLIESQIFNTIKLHLKALELINLDHAKTIKGDMALFWRHTNKGLSLMMELRTV